MNVNQFINRARLAGSIQALETIYSAANIAALPSAADNQGRLIYVQDIGAYRYSDGQQWTNNYDTTTIAGALPGQIWTWGCNASGQLGDGTTLGKSSPVREFCSATDWCSVSAGCYITAAIKTSGQLWAWGCGYRGRHGDGTTVNKCSPVREFCSATDWCRVSAGRDHTAAVKTSGQLWTWGCNIWGQLGDGTTVEKCSPVREFCSATDWCAVSLGGQHTGAIKTTGQIWTWGVNICGQLGDGTTVVKCSPVRERCSFTTWCQVSSAGNLTMALETATCVKR